MVACNIHSRLNRYKNLKNQLISQSYSQIQSHTFFYESHCIHIISELCPQSYRLHDRTHIIRIQRSPVSAVQ